MWHRDGHPVQVGRTSRTVPRRVRRLVEHRDRRRCQVPGCEVRLGLQVHHIHHWEDGGETVTANLVSLCGHHHRLHHAGGLGITGDADITFGRPGAIAFSDEHGRPLLAHPPPGTPPPPSARPYQGPTGERLHKQAVTFARAG